MNANEQQKQTFYTGYKMGFLDISSTDTCVFCFNLLFFDLLLH